MSVVLRRVMLLLHSAATLKDLITVSASLAIRYLVMSALLVQVSLSMYFVFFFLAAYTLTQISFSSLVYPFILEDFMAIVHRCRFNALKLEYTLLCV